MNVLVATIPHNADKSISEQNLLDICSLDESLKTIDYPQYDLVRIASILQPIEDINLHTYDVSKAPIWRLKKYIENNKIDLIILDSFSFQIMDHLKLIITTLKSVKEIRPECITVISGRDPTFFSKQLLTAIEQIDIIVIGESEITLVDLISSLSNNRDLDRANILNNVHGIAFRNKENKIIHTKKRDLLNELDNLPYLNYKYLNVNSDTEFMLSTARGCPFSCNFCYKMFRKVRCHSPSYILAHIAYLNEMHGAKHFTFDDEITGTNPKWLKEFNTLLRNNSMEINYNCYGRADLVTDELVRLHKESGCNEFRIGVESGSEIILKAMNKKISRDNIKKAFSILHREGISTLCFVLLGYPPENHSTIRETISLLEEIRPTKVSAKLLLVLPGTRLYHDQIEEGFIDDSLYFYEPLPVMPKCELRIDELNAYKDMINEKFNN